MLQQHHRCAEIMSIAYLPEKIFTGSEWLTGHAVLVEGGYIQDLVPASELPSHFRPERLEGALLVPAFIDLQVYGAAGKLFSVFTEPAALEVLVQEAARSGTAYSLPTLATNTKEVFYQAIDATRHYLSAGGKGILGLHLEGPWINPLKRGAHIESLIHPPDEKEVQELLDYGEGVIRMITLAPEVCNAKLVQLIRSRGIVVSAGHSNASLQQAVAGFDAGITAVTHLFNAMSPLGHRAPGLVGAAMTDVRSNASIIPDGYHVDFTAVRVAMAAMKERLFVITDAVTETSSGPYQHYRNGDKFEAAGILSGSALTMEKAVKNLVQYCGAAVEDALRMCSLYPSRVIGMEHELGQIRAGFRASMVALEPDLSVRKLV